MNWFGAMLLGLSSYWIGIGISKGEGERIKALESLISLLNFMKRRMTAEKRALKEIFSDFDNIYLRQKGFLERVCIGNKPLSQLWDSACRILPLSENSLKELYYFGSELGRLPLEEQISRLNACMDALGAELCELRTSLPKKQKSIKTVCGLCGILTAILLL